MVGVTLRRRRLAAELRRLREAAGLTIEQAASRVEVSKSAVSRIENALVGVKIPTLRALFEAYNVEPADADVLLQLARDAGQKDWWQSYNDVMNDQLATYIGFESAAHTLRQYEQTLIPGLFQTPAYAAALLRVFLTPSNVSVERLVELRLARQSKLDHVDSYWAIIDEGALRRRVCAPEDMAQQLRYLVDLSQRRNIDIQVLPHERPVHVAIEGSFLILGFDSKDPDIGLVESIAGQLLLEREGDTKRLSSIFDHLRADALDLASSRDRIERVAQEMEAL